MKQTDRSKGRSKGTGTGGSIHLSIRSTLYLGILLTILATTGAGCAHLGIEPWERDLLSDPSMQLDSDPIETGLDQHIYFSKEASSGGQGFGGGGCGCN